MNTNEIQKKAIKKLVVPFLNIVGTQAEEYMQRKMTENMKNMARKNFINISVQRATNEYRIGK